MTSGVENPTQVDVSSNELKKIEEKLKKTEIAEGRKRVADRLKLDADNGHSFCSVPDVIGSDKPNGKVKSSFTVSSGYSPVPDTGRY